jgi:hypothetical protein
LHPRNFALGEQKCQFFGLIRLREKAFCVICLLGFLINR